MIDPKHGLRLVATAYSLSADSWTENGITVRRVTGGSNNALYQLTVDGQRFACKLCVQDERRRAAQEYFTLRLLEATKLDLAPKPIYLDESCTIVPYPAVLYSWLTGTSLVPPLTQHHLSAVLDSLQQIHGLRRSNYQTGLSDSWFHWFDWSLYTQELQELLGTFGPWLAEHEVEGPTLYKRLALLVKACHEITRSTGISPARERVTRCLCRVDPNLANTVWGPEKRLRWVDWEYSGWGDPALDMVEFRWHAALSGLSADQHSWLRDNYRQPEDDPDFSARVFVWDHIIAVRWCFLILRHLWSQFNGPDRVRLTQQTADAQDVRARLVRFIERAEEFIHVSSVSV
jgi:thiamine kinase-like enzyme